MGHQKLDSTRGYALVNVAKLRQIVDALPTTALDPVDAHAGDRLHAPNPDQVEFGHGVAEFCCTAPDSTQP
jgi:hypothetical protein